MDLVTVEMGASTCGAGIGSNLDGELKRGEGVADSEMWNEGLPGKLVFQF